jgi:hypothetical protein
MQQVTFPRLVETSGLPEQPERVVQAIAAQRHLLQLVERLLLLAQAAQPTPVGLLRSMLQLE